MQDFNNRALYRQHLEQQNEELRKKNIDLILQVEMLKDVLRDKKNTNLE